VNDVFPLVALEAIPRVRYLHRRVPLRLLDFQHWYGRGFFLFWLLLNGWTDTCPGQVQLSWIVRFWILLLQQRLLWSGLSRRYVSDVTASVRSLTSVPSMLEYCADTVCSYDRGGTLLQNCSHCRGRGECIHGICRCDIGYTGDTCLECKCAIHDSRLSVTLIAHYDSSMPERLPRSWCMQRAKGLDGHCALRVGGNQRHHHHRHPPTMRLHLSILWARLRVSELSE